MCFAAVLSCLGSACVGCCCSSLKDCRAKHGPASRIPYIFIMFLFCIFAVVMTLYGDTVIWENSWLDYEFALCPTDTNEACETNGSVYRTSFTLFIFFLIHAILVKFVASFHWLFFTIKLFCLIAVLALTYFIDNTLFNGYASFARYASIVFLLLQVVVLINWAWDVNERVIDKLNSMNDSYDLDDPDKIVKCSICCLQFGLIIATLIIYIIIIIFLIFFYSWFEPIKSSCTFNSTMIGITIVLILITTALPILLGTGSIFSSAVVCAYMTFLLYSGLESFPDETCNTFAQEDTTTNMWVGIFITAAAISYTGFSVSKNTALLDDRDNNDDNNTINMELETKSKSSQETADKSNYDENVDLGESNYDDADDTSNQRTKPDISEDKVKIDQKANVLFHLCMAFSSIYMAMLYTNWGTNTVNSEIAHGRGKISVWINISAQWVTFVLYMWTVVNSKLCPGRFGQTVDEDE